MRMYKNVYIIFKPNVVHYVVIGNNNYVIITNNYVAFNLRINVIRKANRIR